MRPESDSPFPFRRNHWLAGAIAAVPALALTFWIPFANHQEPRFYGIPFLIVWIIGWVLATPLFLYAAYKAEGR